MPSKIIVNTTCNVQVQVVDLHPSKRTTAQRQAEGPRETGSSLRIQDQRGGVCLGIQRALQIPRPMPALELAVAPHAATRSCATASLEYASS